MSIISKDIAKAVAILNSEDVVAIPTETVYGLAGNIFSETAIRRIFEVKQRPLFNPLIVHIHSMEQVEKLAREIPEAARKLAEAFWPGSLTLVLPKTARVPDLITAGKDTVGIRMPNHPLTRSLLQALDFPLAAPSANPFNRISPTKAEHVEQYFKESIQMVLDGGTCENGLESTIIGFEDGQAVLYRLGAIAIEEIEKVVGPIALKNKNESAPNAPGMLEKHYAPKTKLHLVKDVVTFVNQHPNKKIAVILLSNNIELPVVEKVVILSQTVDLKEAAAKLYDTLHALDQLDLDMIVAEEFPARGLGRAINDRLSRAAK